MTVTVTVTFCIPNAQNPDSSKNEQTVVWYSNGKNHTTYCDRLHDCHSKSIQNCWYSNGKNVNHTTYGHDRLHD